MMMVQLRKQHVICVQLLLPVSAVSFAIPASATVVEGGAALVVCVQMTEVSPAATLGTEVIVNLSTMDGSGILYSLHIELPREVEVPLSNQDPAGPEM
jgi:hypothetical protein